MAKFEHITNLSARRRSIANVLHAALRGILQPLKSAGLNGVFMCSGDGVERCCHPIFAAHIGDYMEQIAIVGCKNGDCPRCGAGNKNLGDYDANNPYPGHNI